MQCLAHGRCSLYVDSFLLEFTLFTMQHFTEEFTGTLALGSWNRNSRVRKTGKIWSMIAGLGICKATPMIGQI